MGELGAKHAQASEVMAETTGDQLATLKAAVAAAEAAIRKLQQQHRQGNNNALN